MADRRALEWVREGCPTHAISMPNPCLWDAPHRRIQHAPLLRHRSVQHHRRMYRILQEAACVNARALCAVRLKHAPLSHAPAGAMPVSSPLPHLRLGARRRVLRELCLPARRSSHVAAVAVQALAQREVALEAELLRKFTEVLEPGILARRALVGCVHVRVR